MNEDLTQKASIVTLNLTALLIIMNTINRRYHSIKPFVHFLPRSQRERLSLARKQMGTKMNVKVFVSYVTLKVAFCFHYEQRVLDSDYF